MTAHSHVGASSMERWANCPGSVRLAATLPSKPAGYAAAEGSVAHAICEALLNGERGYEVGQVIEHDGHAVEVTDAMREHCMEYKVIVKGLCDKDSVVHVEQRFQIGKLHEALFGTADCVIWHPKRRHLDVIDFKYGAGLAVEAVGNKQGCYYAVGAMSELGYTPRTVSVHIIQPRCPHADGPHRTADYDALELLDFAADMVEAVKATEAPDAPLVAGHWCRKTFCPAQAICPQMHELAVQTAQAEFREGLSYDPEDLARWLDQAPILEGWIKALREFAYAEAEHGRTPPRYKLVEKRPTEKWAPTTTAAMLASEFGIKHDELVEEKLLTPAKVRKLVPGKNDRERGGKLAAFTVKDSSGHTLVHEDDKRPGVKESAAAEFSAAR